MSPEKNAEHRPAGGRFALQSGEGRGAGARRNSTGDWSCNTLAHRWREVGRRQGEVWRYGCEWRIETLGCNAQCAGMTGRFPGIGVQMVERMRQGSALREQQEDGEQQITKPLHRLASITSSAQSLAQAISTLFLASAGCCSRGLSSSRFVLSTPGKPVRRVTGIGVRALIASSRRSAHNVRADQNPCATM